MERQTLPMPTETFQTPQWVQDAVFYQIFPDRFASSPAAPKPSNLEPWDSPPTYHGFKGGDLLGVVEHLDYLQNLGITAIYFCPIFVSTANHRYHTHDYYAVDPILGGNRALAVLLDEAHSRGIRVVLDGVFNHASRGFYQFNHILENGSCSPYLDWFTIYSFPLYPYGPADQPPGYACWWDLRALPKFNTTTVAVREFLWDVGRYWMERGADGWRLDVPSEIDDDDFWREFRTRVKSVNPDAYIVGEIWGDARRWLQGDQFDAVMNYIFTRACLGLFAGSGRGIDHSVIQNTGLSPVETLDTSDFRNTIDSLLRLYPWQATLAQLNLLGSHDTPRYLTIACEDRSALQLATLFQMTFPGAPCIYYGDEIGMLGGHDPDCRRGFPWDRSRWDTDLLEYVRGCVSLRRSHDVLRRGDFTSLVGEGDVYSFVRRLGDTIAVVAINIGHAPTTTRIQLPRDPRLTDGRLVWGDRAPEMVDGRFGDWHLPSRSGAVYICREAR